MPKDIDVIVDELNPDAKDIATANFKYAYPGNLDFHPESELHREVAARIMERVNESTREIQKRYPIWRAIDDDLEGYMPKDLEERRAENKDVRVPTSNVIPTLTTTIDTLLSHIVSQMQPPLFGYSPQGPEDTLSVLKLQSLVAQQAAKQKMTLNLHTGWRDGIVRGFGAIATGWTVKHGVRTVRQQREVEDLSTGLAVQTDTISTKEPTILYEGNTLQNIYPYHYLPDPNVPVHDVQKGEFVGYVEITNMMNVLDREEPLADSEEATWFNAGYVELLRDARSKVVETDLPTDRERYNIPFGSKSHPVHVVHMYITLIPANWGLGESTRPEKWVFSLAGDEIITRAQPLRLDHDMYPIGVIAPDFDGYRLFPTSRIEIVHNLQKAVNWLWSSRQRDLVKNMHGRYVVNPSLIYMPDLRDHRKTFIRMKQPAWQKAPQDAVQQLNTADATAENMSSIGYLTQMMQQTTGAHPGIQGIQRQGGERVTAQESGNVFSAGYSRIGRTIVIGEMQGLQDISFMLASNTCQMMSEETYTRILGRADQDLNGIFAQNDIGDPAQVEDGQLHKVTFADLNCNYDVVPVPTDQDRGENINDLVQLVQTLLSQPELAQMYDVDRWLRYIFWLKGIKNVPDFRRKDAAGRPAQPVLQQNAQVPQQNAQFLLDGNGAQR